MWSGLFWAGLFSLGLNLLMLAAPLYSMQLYDRVPGSGHVETLLLSLAGGFAILALGLFDMVRALLLGRVAVRFEMAVLPAKALITTGERTVLAYLLQPVWDTFRHGVKES